MEAYFEGLFHFYSSDCIQNIPCGASHDNERSLKGQATLDDVFLLRALTSARIEALSLAEVGSNPETYSKTGFLRIPTK